MDKLVVIINGSGGVGKDTVCEAAAVFWKTRSISSITPILQVARAAGWDGVKTPASRRFSFRAQAELLRIQRSSVPLLRRAAKHSAEAMSSCFSLPYP
ncbi:MAG: hypothetical protein ACLR4Z_06900 [Butyricicoccaceae bacterium]